MTTMLFNLFGTKHDKTEGVVRATSAAREKVELAADKLNRTLDIIDGNLEITVKGFMDQTRAVRRDQT